MKMLIEIDTDTQVVVPWVPTNKMKKAYYESSISLISYLSNPGYHAMLAAAAAAPQPQPAPTPTIERLPTEADGDYRGRIWRYNKHGGACVMWFHVRENDWGYTHWLPTGMKKPPAPGGDE